MQYLKYLFFILPSIFIILLIISDSIILNIIHIIIILIIILVVSLYLKYKKVKELKLLLNKKDLIIKELNHRFKNNMQMLISSIEVFINDTNNKDFNEILVTIQNRINAIKYLQEQLCYEKNITKINIYIYFETLIEELQNMFNKTNIKINMNINVDVKVDDAFLLGLIINELIINSLKYAFPNNDGYIEINLNKYNNKYSLVIIDNGIGYVKNDNKNSIGLSLVESLVTKQLKGSITTHSENGVKIEISWKNET